MLGPALLCWAAMVGLLPLSHSPLAFLSYRTVFVIAVLLALCETVLDKAPGTPSRVDSVPLFFRFVSGAFCGAALALACQQRAFFPLLLRCFGALIGGLVGYRLRKFMMNSLRLPNVAAGLLEDILVVFAGLWFFWWR
jgi:uncharacterized membrane protein